MEQTVRTLPLDIIIQYPSPLAIPFYPLTLSIISIRDNQHPTARHSSSSFRTHQHRTMSTSSSRHASAYYVETLVPSLDGSQRPEYNTSNAERSIVSASSSRSGSTALPPSFLDLFRPGTVRHVGPHRVKSLRVEHTSRRYDRNHPDRASPERTKHLGHTPDGDFSILRVQEDVEDREGRKRQQHLYCRPATTRSTRIRSATSRTSTTGPSQQRLLAPIDEEKKSEILHWTGDVSSKVGTQCSRSNKATSKWEGTVVPDDSISQVTERVGSQQGGGGSGSRRGYKYVNLTAWDWS